MARSKDVAERAAQAAQRLGRRGAQAREGPDEIARSPMASLGTQLGVASFLADRAAYLEERLAEVRDAYQGVRLADRYEVEEHATKKGRFLRMRQPTSIGALQLPNSTSAEDVLTSQLDLVPGIGPCRWADLNQRGLQTIVQLASGRSPAIYRSDAAAVLAEIGQRDLTALHERLRRRLGGRRQILASLLAATVDLSDIGFLDVETLGLSNQPIFLVGVGRFVGKEFVVDQYLAPRPTDEATMLRAALEALDGIQLLVTYNGSTADVPWIRNRCSYHRLSGPPSVAHLDLLYATRRRWTRDEARLPNARLPTVQSELLGVERPEHDIPSHLVPEFYDSYRGSPDDECLLVPIIDHNRSDIEALASLLELQCAEALHLDASPVV